MSNDDSDTAVKNKVKSFKDIDAELAELGQQDIDPSEFYEHSNSSPVSENQSNQQPELNASQDAEVDADDASKDLLAANYIKNITAGLLAEKDKPVDPIALINSLNVQKKLSEGKKAASLLEAKASETAKSEQEEAEAEAERIKAEAEAERIKAEAEAERIKAEAEAKRLSSVSEDAPIKPAAQQSIANASPEDILKAFVANQSPGRQAANDNKSAPADQVLAPVESVAAATAMQPMQIKATTNNASGLYSASQPARAKVIPLFPNSQNNPPPNTPERSPELAVSDKFIYDLATKRLARTEDKRLAFLMERGKEHAMYEAGQTERIDLNNQKREKAERALARVETLYHGDRVSPVEPNLGAASTAPANPQSNPQSTATNAAPKNNASETNSTDNGDDADETNSTDNDDSDKKNDDSILSVKNNPNTGGMSAKADLNQVGAMLAGMTHGAITGVFSSMAGVGYGVYRTLRHAGIEHRVEKHIKQVQGLDKLKKTRDAHAKAVHDHIKAMEKEEAKEEGELAKKQKLKAGKVDLVKPIKDPDGYQASVDKKNIDLLNCNKLTKTHLNNVYSEYNKFNTNNKFLDDKSNPLSDADRVKAKDATRNAFDKYIRNAEGLNNNISQNLKKGDDGDIAAAGLLSSMNKDMQINMGKSKKKGNLRSQKNDEQAMSQVMKKTSALLSSLGKALKSAFSSMGKKRSP